MSGYTPLFSSLTTGTLCGKWPDIGLWAVVLSLSDKSGVVDVTPAYISSVTGLPIEDVVACMERFCKPDPYSRSVEEGGARLELLDPGHRAWGWRIVNHGKYRERARLSAKSAREVESGSNALRMGDRRRPPETAGDPLSNSNTDTDSDKRTEARKRASRLPDDFECTPERFAYGQREGINVQREFEKFCDHWRSAGGANARKYDWDAAWRLWCRRAADDLKRPMVPPTRVGFGRQPETPKPKECKHGLTPSACVYCRRDVQNASGGLKRVLG